MKTLGHIAGIATVTLICAIVVHAIAGDIFQTLDACTITDWQCNSSAIGAAHAVAFLGGVGGFWLVYTGRLVRMFRKV